MKIFFWTDGFFPSIGGIETQTLRLVKGLQALNYTCFVLANQDGAALQQEYCNGINIARFKFSLFKAANTNGTDIVKNFKEKLLNIVNEFEPDVVHLSLYLRSHSALAYMLLQKMLPCPVVLTLHSIPFVIDKPFSLVNNFFSSADRICCVSKFVVDQVKLYAPSAMHKTSLIYNGLPVPKLLPSILSFTSPAILCLGRFSEEKGFDLAIQAFAKVYKYFPQAQLILAGDGPGMVLFKKLVDDLELSGAVTFSGAIKVEDVPAMMNQATMILMPSHTESFGLVALEAAQMERPIIASAVGGLLEVVVHQETGILVPPNNIDALYEAIMTLLNNPSLAIAMGKRARIRALHHFSVENMLDSYQQVYSDIVKNKPKEIVDA